MESFDISELDLTNVASPAVQAFLDDKMTALKKKLDGYYKTKAANIK